MAKRNSSCVFQNATINIEDDTITEYNKDDIKEYRLSDILKEWDGIENIALTIKHVDEIKALNNNESGEHD